jgi:hypothetical protein
LGWDFPLVFKNLSFLVLPHKFQKQVMECFLSAERALLFSEGLYFFDLTFKFLNDFVRFERFNL